MLARGEALGLAFGLMVDGLKSLELLMAGGVEVAGFALSGADYVVALILALVAVVLHTRKAH